MYVCAINSFLVLPMGFSRKNCYPPPPPVEDINGEIPRGRAKVVGGTLKIEEKTWISRGLKQKNGKFQGGGGLFDWKSRGSTTKNQYSQQGRYNYFLENPNYNG